jgi:hypothetical protein
VIGGGVLRGVILPHEVVADGAVVAPMVSTGRGEHHVQNQRHHGHEHGGLPDSFCPVSIRFPRAKWNTSGSSKSQKFWQHESAGHPAVRVGGVHPVQQF